MVVGRRLFAFPFHFRPEYSDWQAGKRVLPQTSQIPMSHASLKHGCHLGRVARS